MRSSNPLCRMRLFFAFLLFLTIVGPSGADAATMRYAAPSELARLSDAVVVAQVIEAEVLREANGRVVTLTRFSVVDVWRGTAPRELVVRQWGGALDGEVHAVSGDAVLPRGVSLLLFLRESSAGHFTLTALSQSVFTMDVVPPDLDLGAIQLGDIAAATGFLMNAGWARTLDGVLGAGAELPHREVWELRELHAAVLNADASVLALPTPGEPASNEAAPSQPAETSATPNDPHLGAGHE